MKKDPTPAKTKTADLAYIDDLTGLYNRRYLNITLSEEIQNAKEKKAKLSLFMIDYDGFKGINDTYGHLAGDRALIGIADILKKEVGESGTLIRYAGDEFTVLLPKKNIKESVKVANNLLRLASEHKTKLKDGKKLSSFVKIFL